MVGYFYVCVSELFCDVGGLFACVREYGPGLCCGFSLWVWRDYRVDFLGRIGKELCFDGLTHPH